MADANAQRAVLLELEREAFELQQAAIAGSTRRRRARTGGLCTKRSRTSRRGSA